MPSLALDVASIHSDFGTCVFVRAADVDEIVRKARERVRVAHTIIFLKIYGTSIVGGATQPNAIYAFLLRQRIVVEYILCNFVTHISIAV